MRAVPVTTPGLTPMPLTVDCTSVGADVVTCGGTPVQCEGCRSPARGGELIAINEVTHKRTTRDFDSLLPKYTEVSLADAHGRDYQLRADINAGGNWRTWQNVDAAYCLARWELEGRVSYGDFQEVQGADDIRQFTNPVVPER